MLFIYLDSCMRQDMHLENFLYSDPVWFPLTPGQTKEIYFLMDFGSSRLVSGRPGNRPPALTDFRERDGGHWPPPEGMGMVDPYAYDVYCAGLTVIMPAWVNHIVGHSTIALLTC